MGQVGAVQAVEILVTLLGVAMVVAIAVRRLHLPYSVALVLVGFAVAAIVSALRPGERLTIGPDLVLIVLLPGLVFEAGYRLDLAHLRRTLAGLLLLAAPGVFISAGIVGVTLHLVVGMPLDLAFVVGAMVSATDPVAVIATFRELRTPAAVATLVEGESLANDGTGLVVFALALKAVGTPVAPTEVAVSFVAIVVASLAIGAAAGWIASRFMGLTDDHLVELTVSVVLAYGTYLVADQVHASGVIATVTAAIVLGNYGRPRTMSETGSGALDTVWEFLAFVMTAVVFLLIGFAVQPAQLAGSIGPIAVAIVAVMAARAVVVYGLLGIPSRLIAPRASGMPPGWLHVLFWAGLRGAVSVAMALALPEDLPQRATLQEITFGVVVFTLFVQGTTARAVVSRALGTSGAGSAGSGGSPAS